MSFPERSWEQTTFMKMSSMIRIRNSVAYNKFSDNQFDQCKEMSDGRNEFGFRDGNFLLLLIGCRRQVFAIFLRQALGYVGVKVAPPRRDAFNVHAVLKRLTPNYSGWVAITLYVMMTPISDAETDFREYETSFDSVFQSLHTFVSMNSTDFRFQALWTRSIPGKTLH